MAGWCRHTGVAVALDRENIDTDQLIPARFMSTPRAQGYGGFLLHDLRTDASGAPVPDFPLNKHPDADVLIARRNFGSGSSREAAVYALVDAGFRAVVAPSFADIFASNAINNGLLPAQVESTDALFEVLKGRTLPARADLEAQTVTVGEVSLPFSIDPIWREKLVKGWDDIDMTQAHQSEISAFRDTHRRTAPWVFDEGRNTT